MTTRRLQKFYEERAGGGEPPPGTRLSTSVARYDDVNATTTAIGATSAKSTPLGATALMGVSDGGSSSTAAVTSTGRLGPTAYVTAEGAGTSSRMNGREKGRNGVLEMEACRPQTCPVPEGGAHEPAGGFSVRDSVGSDALRSKTSRGDSRYRRRRKPLIQGEDVRRLLLRAMVGYDWVDEFNGQEMRVRGAFTERDVGVLEVRARSSSTKTLVAACSLVQ